MGLTSGSLLVTAVVLALAAAAAAVLLPDRLRGPRPWRLAQQAGVVLLAQLLAVSSVALSVNDKYSFYVSWSDLLGSPPSAGPIVASTGGRLQLRPEHSRALPDGQREVDLRVRGTRSHAVGLVRVYLPPGYDSPANAHRRYPVVELIAGYHENPESWDTAFDLPEVLAPLHEAGRVRDFIGVAPQVDLAGDRDLECNDVPDGPQAETWIGADTRDLVLSRFRAVPARAAWGIVGYSSGGYCAVKLLLHHPTWYHSVVAMDSSFYAIKDGSTGELWGGDPVRRERNDVIWLLRHGEHPDSDVLVFVSRQDGESYRPTLDLLAAAAPPMRTSSLVVDRGGHNLRALSQALPQMLAWLSAHLQDSADPNDPDRRFPCPYCAPVLPPTPSPTVVPSVSPTPSARPSATPRTSPTPARPRPPRASPRPTSPPRTPASPRATATP